MKPVIAIAFAVIGATGCMSDEPVVGTERTNGEIVGGVAAQLGQYPTVAALKLQTPNGTGLCTATLIAPNVLLTAKHCTVGRDVSQITAVFDQLDAFGTGGITATIAEKVEHPGWSSNNLGGGKDLALLRLTTPLTDRTPTAINTDATNSATGVQVTMAGFGRRNPNVQNDSGLLYVLTGKPYAACSNFGLGGSEGALACYSQAAPNASGKCNGDSGGPSFATVGGVQKVVGVTSFGDASCTGYGADIQVDAELAFLQPVLTNWALPGNPPPGGNPPAEPPGQAPGDDEAVPEEGTASAIGGQAAGGCSAGAVPSAGGALVMLLALAWRRRRG
ncbi:MAG: trypsin-like serine protease [Myxococcales bacterium]|nr:trypsin-like serine protease [Myxococcales bacterium]